MTKITIDTAGASPVRDRGDHIESTPLNAYTVRDLEELHGSRRIVSRADGAIEA